MNTEVFALGDHHVMFLVLFQVAAEGSVDDIFGQVQKIFDEIPQPGIIDVLPQIRNKIWS